MSNNLKILNGCVQKYKEENSLEIKDSEIFELFALTQVTKNIDMSFDSISNSIVDGGNDGGIDSVIIRVDNEVVESIGDLEEIDFSNSTVTSVTITQCKTEKSLKEVTIDKLLSSCEVIFNLNKDEKALFERFNPALFEKITILRKAWMDTSVSGGVINIGFNYCCLAAVVEYNTAFQSKTDQLIQLVSSHCANASVDFNCFSCEELIGLYQTRIASRFTLPFKDQPLSTSFGQTGIGYMGTVKLGEYKKFLTHTDGSIKEHIFESNIRDFQGSTIDVNKKIAKTLAENTLSDFWWLNNGITMIAENPNLAGRSLSIDNVQIVNGLQSSYSIFNSHDGSESDERSVLVKVIINNDKDIIDNIIESTNSQNAVSATTLRASDTTQKKMELYFLNHGLYYDRRKNYYKNQSKPAAKIFSIQFAAQAIETIGFDSPHSARTKPTSLIKDDKTYNRIFDESNDFGAYLNCCLILKKTNEYCGLLNTEEKKATSNLKLHLARVATSIILNKTEYTFDDLAQINLDTYDQDLFDEACGILILAVNSYVDKTKGLVNLINMAKSKPFSEQLLSELSNRIGS